MLKPLYYIDKNKASNEMIFLFERDIKCACFYESRSMFFLLYDKYKERILKIILNCFNSKDKDLVKIGTYSIVEMYIIKNEFLEFPSNLKNMTNKQIEYVIEMVIQYFNNEKYNDICKNIISKFISNDVQIDLTQLFYDNLIDLNRDKSFVLDLLKSKYNKDLLYDFFEYLKENSYSFLCYKDIIFECLDNSLNKFDLNNIDYMLEEIFPKLIMGLYDEVMDSPNFEDKAIAEKCLDFLDVLFEKEIGSAKKLSIELMNR
jgi:hypothetical protein